MIALREPVDARELLARFGGFFDAVLVEVTLSLPRESARRRASLSLLAQESSGAESAGRWRTITLEIEGVSGYRLSEGPDTYLVLSDGLQIEGVGEARCLVNLAPDQVAQSSAGEGPAQFVAGLSCSYELGDFAP